MGIIKIKFKVVWNSLVSLDAYTIGDFIDGVELEFKDGGTLPMTDIDWGTDKVEYIQFTGLKDKNGREIFKGDLVKAVQKGQTKTGEVVFAKGMFGWEFEKGKISWLFEVNRKWDAEVVGNIYEKK